MNRREREKQIACDNLTAALAILTDPDRYGGESALCVRWARSLLANQNYLELNMERKAA